MTAVASHLPRDEPRSERRISRLSGRIISLMACCVAVVQVLIYIPAISAFRASWLSDRVMGAQMVALALTATPREAISTDLETRLLSGIKGAQALGVRGPGTRWLLATSGEAPPAADREIDLRNAPWWGPLRGAIRTLVVPASGPSRIIGDGAPGMPGVEWVELIIDEAPLRAAMLAFSRTFLLVTLALSAAAAAALYLALHLTVVRPVRRLTENISAFAANPADTGRILRHSGRTDELGRAETALAQMEGTLAAELRQKRHLADLGLAVSKINHELRNMLTTAQLLGDRLRAVDDPAVKTIAPRLVRTLDRAIRFCEATLSYGRATEAAPERSVVRLKPLVLEQLDLAHASDPVVRLDVDIPEDLRVDADGDQLGRVVLNLVRNAVAALQIAKTVDGTIWISGQRTARVVTLRIADSGPGVPAPIRNQLFTAFQASGRSGGTGLGLPVASEIVALHGGTLTLESTSGGASFLVTIPDRMTA